MAYRTIINKVLRRLREETITAEWIGALPDSDADGEALTFKVDREAVRSLSRGASADAHASASAQKRMFSLSLIRFGIKALTFLENLLPELLNL